MQSILVLRLGQLGDVLLATPLLRQLRRQYPNARLDVAVAQKFVDVWANNPHCTSIIPIDTTTSFIATRPVIRRILDQHGRYDVAIDLHRNLRTWYLRRSLAKNVFCYDKHRTEKRALVQQKEFPAVVSHVVQRYQAAASKIGCSNDGRGLELWLPEEKNSSDYPPAVSNNSVQTKRIALAAGAQHATKRWLPEYFAQVAEYYASIGFEIVLIGSPKEQELCENIRTRVSEIHRDNVIVQTHTTLFESARVLDTCRVCISNDSGAVHLAAARRIPVVAIYGSTVPAFGFTPYGIPHKVAEVQLSCRPCTHIGKNECPLGHYNCMKLIEPELVIAHTDSLMKHITQ